LRPITIGGSSSSTSPPRRIFPQAILSKTNVISKNLLKPLAESQSSTPGNPTPDLEFTDHPTTPQSGQRPLPIQLINMTQKTKLISEIQDTSQKQSTTQIMQLVAKSFLGGLPTRGTLRNKSGGYFSAT
jgi:hypothetical protein